MRRASIVHGLLKYHACCCKRGSKKETALMFPNLQAILQQAARMAGGISKTGCKGSYGSYGTPTDETIIRAAWGSPGGQIDRLT
jgi:hypothetical protein